MGWGWGTEVEGTINEELLAARGSWVDRPVEERKPYGWCVCAIKCYAPSKSKFKALVLSNTTLRENMFILEFSMKESPPQFHLGFDGLVINTT